MSSHGVVIVAHRGDVGAAALATLLRRRGRCRTHLVDAQAISSATFSHRPDSGRLGQGGDRSPQDDRVILPDGEVISAATDVLLCRVDALNPPPFASWADQEYAGQEFFALALSWLHGLGSAVINRPSPRGLAGGAPDVLALPGLAASVGLKAARIRMCSNSAGTATKGRKEGWQRWDGTYVPVTAEGSASSSPGPPLAIPGLEIEPMHLAAQALVCGAAVVGAPAGLERSVSELVHAAGLDVAEVWFGIATNGPHHRGEPVVLRVNPVPSLRGPRHVETLASYLETRAVRRRHAIPQSMKGLA